MKKHCVVIGLLLLLASVVVLALTPAETINRICDMVEDGSVSPEHASEIAKQHGIEYTPDQFAAEKRRRKEKKELLQRELLIPGQICSMVRSGVVTFGEANAIAESHGIKYTQSEFIFCLPPSKRLAYQRAVFGDVVKNDSNTSHANSDDLASRVDDLESKINDLDGKYSDLNSRMDDLESRINDLDSKYSNLNSKVDDLESKINDLDSKYNDLNNRVDDLETSR